MGNKIKTLNQDSSFFVEALEEVVRAEEKVLSIYKSVYGEKGGEIFSESGCSAHFEAIREELKDSISYYIEGEIHDKIDKEEERV